MKTFFTKCMSEQEVYKLVNKYFDIKAHSGKTQMDFENDSSLSTYTYNIDGGEFIVIDSDSILLKIKKKFIVVRSSDSYKRVTTHRIVNKKQEGIV